MKIVIEIWPSLAPDDQSAAELLAGGAAVASEFHFEAVEQIANRLDTQFERLTDSRFKSSDD